MAALITVEEWPRDAIHRRNTYRGPADAGAIARASPRRRATPMTLRIVTDSSSCLPSGWAEANGVTVIPQGVVLDGTAYRENVDLSGDDFYHRLQGGATATSSQPRPEDFAAAYRTALDAGDQVLSIHIGSRLSSTLDTAHSQAALLAAKGPAARGSGAPAGSRIHLVDSNSAGLGLGFLVMEAVRLAQLGGEPAAIVRELESMATRIRVYFMLHTMTYLVRGGRVGRAAGLAGALLGLRPILTFDDGRIAPAGRTRTARQAASRLWDLVSDAARGGITHAGFHYGLNRDEVEGWRREFAERFGMDSLITQLGPAVGAHSGPWILGIVLIVEA